MCDVCMLRPKLSRIQYILKFNVDAGTFFIIYYFASMNVVDRRYG